MDDIAIRIKELRKKRGMTQGELSAKSGVPQGNISAMERGRRYAGRMSLETGKKLAQALETSVDYLLGLQGDCHH